MKTKAPCPTCEHPIPLSADVCPKCGSWVKWNLSADRGLLVDERTEDRATD
jgi:endogenous inhibitor of DNA gyrase (YacG/DUF329 family)